MNVVGIDASKGKTIMRQFCEAPYGLPWRSGRASVPVWRMPRSVIDLPVLEHYTADPYVKEPRTSLKTTIPTSFFTVPPASTEI